jgi:hypothetical protein
MAELDRLEQAVAGADAADEAEQSEVVRRLQTMLSRLAQSRSVPDDPGMTSRIESASADEIFALIDSELSGPEH